MKQETKCIQAGYEPKNGESRMIPIIQSTTFKYDTSEDMGKLFEAGALAAFFFALPAAAGAAVVLVSFLISSAMFLPDF